MICVDLFSHYVDFCTVLRGLRDHINAQAEYRRSWTYGQASNAIDIRKIL